MAHLTLGIDIGSTATKVVLLDTVERTWQVASRPSALLSAHAGWAEANPVQWWDNTVSLVHELIDRDPAVHAGDIGAIACTAMTPAVLAVDADDRPLRRAILQNDARASAEVADAVSALVGTDVLAATGSAVTQQSVGPTWRWLRRHEPAVAANTKRLVGGAEWMATRLGARRHNERNWVLEAGLYDVAGAPLDAMFEHCGIDSGLIDPPLRSSTVVGAVSPVVANTIGLPVGTPIVVGGADHVLSAFAAGLSNDGDTLIKLGGAGDILTVTSERLVDPRLYLDEHPVEGLFMPNGCMATSGTMLRWLNELTSGASSGAHGYRLDELDAAATNRPAASLLCLPYFLGEKSPLHDPNLRGAFLGLGLHHDRVDLHRAALEAIAYGFRHHLDVFAERGITPRRCLISNGGSTSTLWKQIIADVCDLSLQPVIDHPGAALGAAAVAAVGIDLLSWPGAADLVATGPQIDPNQVMVDHYAMSYQLWRDAARSVAPISHRLAASSTPPTTSDTANHRIETENAG